MTAGLLGLVSADSHAARSVRADSSDSAFDSLGGFWGSDNFQFGGPGFATGRTDFKLKINPNGNARFFNVCMGEGFLRLIGSDLACTASDFTGPPTSSYVAVFATDFDDASGSWIRTRGFVDTVSPYRLGQAAPATRFWWSGVTLAGDGTFTPFDVQVVLIDRSKGTNNGDFDIEMNYGQGGGESIPPVPNSDGFQGIVLGPNHKGPLFGPFGPSDSNGAPIRFCFRGGKLRSC
jgi:hypothetical protein